jgi:hypothetical protein
LTSASHQTSFDISIAAVASFIERAQRFTGYREQGYTFEQIARHMKCSISVAHGYVVEGMDAIPLENAKAVLAMELRRLDQLQSAYYEKAIEGFDLPALHGCLRVMDQRAKLLGLNPEEGKAQVLISAGAPGGQKPESSTINVVFAVPGKKPWHDTLVGSVSDKRLLPAPPRWHATS